MRHRVLVHLQIVFGIVFLLMLVLWAQDPYDPNKLSAGEIACGRNESKKTHPCECMKARIKKADAAREKCFLIENKELYNECMLDAEPCAQKVVDQDHAGYGEEAVPVECKRSCTKARCECCQT